jgi:2-polyprenyl-6-methoxyphenol hydroxylase-like FAD-dependent oxidoreductase
MLTLVANSAALPSYPPQRASARPKVPARAGFAEMSTHEQTTNPEFATSVKGGIERVKSEGLKAFRKRVIEMSPFLADRVGEFESWDDVKLLSVTVDRLRRWWRPGLICIGDAAHAMSPIGGVGINMAVQDAVAAANRLASPLRSGTVTDDDLQVIQKRRALPVRFTQWLQLTIQKRIISRVLVSRQRPKPPLFFKLFGIFPVLRRIPARLIGIGIRPEHVRTPEAAPL